MARPSCLSAPAVRPPEKSADAVIISGLCTIDVHEMIGKILRKYYTLMIITASADLSGAALRLVHLGTTGVPSSVCLSAQLS